MDLDEEKVFWRTIADKRGDRAEIAVYADWLVERNDPRGEPLQRFVASGLIVDPWRAAWEPMPDGAPKIAEATDAWKERLASFGKLDVGVYHGLPYSVGAEHGAIDSAARLVEAMPFVTLQISFDLSGTSKPPVASTFASSLLSHVRSLGCQTAYSDWDPEEAYGLTTFHCADEVLAAMVDSPNVARVERLLVTHSQISSEGMESLVACAPRLPALRWLDLSNNTIHADQAVALAGVFPRLERLHLESNWIEKKDMQALRARLAAIPDVKL
jgi:uncharacterized protein (TIGR02996 family)